jgi:hypothetical protein
MKTIATLIATAAMLIATTTLVGCGSKSDDSPEGMCKKIYKERVDGVIKIFAEEGPKNKAAFTAHCEKLPVEYLKCEAKDLMKMSEKEMDSCMEQIKVHQDDLNTVLMTGKVDDKK